MIVRFTGRLYEWRGPAPFHFVDLDTDASDLVASVKRQLTYGWGVVMVTARVGDLEWKTSLMPRGQIYALPIKDAIRKSIGLELNDPVDVELELAV